MKKTKFTYENMMKIVVFVVLACTYIIPTGLIETKYQISKILFVIPMLLMYMLTLKKISKREIIFILIIVGLILYTKDIKYIIFMTIIFLDKIIEHKQYIKDYLKESNILYICLIATIIYSIMFWGTNGRYAFTAIKEINQSGLAIFCLGVMLMSKNKKVGIATLIFGMFTISRSYFLAIIIYAVSKIKFIKKYCIKEIIVKLSNYISLTIISSIGLVLLGVFYVYQYKIGNIFWGDEVTSRLYTFLDYSNFFRFSLILILMLILVKKPKMFITGMTTEQYINLGKGVADELSIPYKYIEPHNLFFSHLKMYGIFSLVETVYIHLILRKVVDKENFLLYIAIFLYSIILGAGLYSYWLYLTFFVLVLNEDIEKNEQTNNKAREREEVEYGK